MCQSNEKGSLSFSMWQRSQACLTVHARSRLSVLGYLYSTFSYERRASCCSPTCASGAMVWTPRVPLSSGLTRRPLGGPPTSRAPHLTLFHPRCLFLTTPSFHSPRSPVVWTRRQIGRHPSFPVRPVLALLCVK